MEIDRGCGEFLRAMAQQATGTDISWDLICKAAKTAAKMELDNIRFTRGNFGYMR